MDLSSTKIYNLHEVESSESNHVTLVRVITIGILFCNDLGQVPILEIAGTPVRVGALYRGYIVPS